MTMKLFRFTKHQLFQGYIAGYQHLPKNCEYIFCADDLLVNPQFDEENILNNLNCHNKSYIKYLNLFGSIHLLGINLVNVMIIQMMVVMLIILICYLREMNYYLGMRSWDLNMKSRIKKFLRGSR